MRYSDRACETASGAACGFAGTKKNAKNRISRDPISRAPVMYKIAMFKIPFFSIFVLLVFTSPVRLRAGSKVTVGANVPPSRQVSIDRINHTDWDTLLRKYCDEQGYVNYQAWRNSQADLQQLDQYLAHLSRANQRASLRFGSMPTTRSP